MPNIDEKFLAGNRALLTITDRKSDIDRELKPGMLNYTSEDLGLYLTVPRSKNYGEYKKLVAADVDGKIAGPLVFKGNVSFEGTVNIPGGTTSVNTTNLNIEDNIIELNSLESGDGITLNTSGIQIHRGTRGTANILYSESDLGWVLDTNGVVRFKFTEAGVFTPSSGIVTNNLTVNTSIIVPTPVLDMNPTTKKYVDDAINGVTSGENTAAIEALKIFSTVIVASQPTIVPVSNDTSITFAAGNGIALTTNNTTKTLTVSPKLGNGIAADANGLKLVNNTSIQKISVFRAGILIGSRKAINFTDGNIDISEDIANDKIDITIGSAGGTGSIFSVSADGLVPAPGTSSGKFLRDDGAWVGIAGGGGTVIEFYESWYKHDEENSATLIPINIENFNYNSDLLEVFWNGILLEDGEHYTVKNNNLEINIKDWKLNIGDTLYFKVLKGGEQSSTSSTTESYQNVDSSNNVFELNAATCKNFKVRIFDQVTKTLNIVNVQNQTEVIYNISVLVEYTELAEINYPSGTSWRDGAAPMFAKDKYYLLLFMSYDSGNSWMASCIGAWDYAAM